MLAYRSQMRIYLAVESFPMIKLLVSLHIVGKDAFLDGLKEYEPNGSSFYENKDCLCTL